MITKKHPWTIPQMVLNGFPSLRAMNCHYSSLSVVMRIQTANGDVSWYIKGVAGFCGPTTLYMCPIILPAHFS